MVCGLGIALVLRAVVARGERCADAIARACLGRALVLRIEVASLERAAHTRSCCRSDSTGELTRRTFGPNFIALRQFVQPLVSRTVSERR